MSQPLVATLSIDPDAQSYFDDLRKGHFPKERNYLNAHLTLFNALPDEPWILEKMRIVTDILAGRGSLSKDTDLAGVKVWSQKSGRQGFCVYQSKLCLSQQ